MTERLSIHFQPDIRSKATSLASQVEQIISQRGAFRNVSEQDLRDEIKKLVVETGVAEVEDVNDNTSDDEDPQAQGDKLWKDRDEMLQKLSYAQNEILSALDFVSLLLSNHTVGAQSTMSPALKELVPPKSLDGRIVEYQIPTKSQREQLSAVSEGWKAESFGEAASKLEAASVRLERQTERQSQYWQQIAQLQDQGWSISRHPSDSRAIGVHFGSQESASQFRARGFTLLPQDDDGNVYLDSRSGVTKRSLLRVSVVRKGVETGFYSFPSIDYVTVPGVESELIVARDNLFIEELFYEISREARSIANQNVRTQPHAVEANITHDCQIKLAQSDVELPNHPSGSDEDDKFAQLIANCLCSLLLAEHQRLHVRRAQPPPPMSMGSVSNTEYAILRPVLTLLRHRQQLVEVAQHCRLFFPSFKAAGLPMTLDFATHPADVSLNELDSLESLRMKKTTSISIMMQGNIVITIDLSTYLGLPSYGTTYEIAARELDFAQLQKVQVDNINELRTSLVNLLELVLVSHVKSLSQLDELQTAGSVEWELVRPHAGEFLISKGDRNIAKVLISIQSGCLALQTVQASSTSKQKIRKNAYLWRASGLQMMPADNVDNTEASTFDEVLKGFGTSLED